MLCLVSLNLYGLNLKFVSKGAGSVIFFQSD